MTDDVFSAEYGPITISADPATGLSSIEFNFPEHGAVVAVLSADEMQKIKPLFDHIAGHAATDEPARIDLRAAFLDLIGRDPFAEQV
jgi:hypothetical protein